MFSTLMDIYFILGGLLALFVMFRLYQKPSYKRGNLALGAFSDGGRSVRSRWLRGVAILEIGLFVNVLWPLVLSAAFSAPGRRDSLVITIESL